MTHNWKRGDVAEYDGHRVMLTDRPAGLTWVDDEGDARNITRPTWDRICRPLLVIDPDDRAQIMRLAEAWDAQAHVTLEDGEPMSLSGWRMQAALRALLEPELEEPEGIGALVICAGDGEPSVRIAVPDKWPDDEKPKEWSRFGQKVAWSDLPRPLTVLSPGYVEEGE